MGLRPSNRPLAVLEAVARGLSVLLGLLMFLMVVVIFVQVIARYVFHNSLSWSEEIGRYLFIWITFLGAVIGVKERLHVGVDVAVKAMPAGVQRILVLVGNLLMIVFVVYMLQGSFKLLDLGRNQVSPATSIPMLYPYLILPLASILMLVYLLVNTVLDWINVGGR
ncbi:MAG TPA: TRAP transporter small permease [Peptococcaceae bacterium]|nr:MAG: Tripartite ATP-independent periplasmic transporter DctQ component [Moorella sp. 60_41]HBT47612.1 TRAP transporter small permease [Peptococcaceae bacterium]